MTCLPPMPVIFGSKGDVITIAFARTANNKSCIRGDTFPYSSADTQKPEGHRVTGLDRTDPLLAGNCPCRITYYASVST
jgi:hypothetical protein